jgi:hypothetical protein
MADDSATPPDEAHRRRVRELFAALTLFDEIDSVEPPPLSFRELVAFLCGNLELSDEQQDYLFADERLLRNFHCLVRDLAVKRSGDVKRGGDEPIEDEPIHLPLRAAASDETELRRWIFGGGLMRIRPFGPGEELLTIFLDQTLKAPTSLLLESSIVRRLALVDLRRPHPAFSSGINIVLNNNLPNHRGLRDILLNSRFEGFLLNTGVAEGV